MRIASCIAAYTIKPDKLSLVADQLKKVGDVFIFSPDDAATKYGTHIKTDPALKEHTVFEPRKWMKNHLTDYDFFYYGEDDVLVGAKQIKFALDFQKLLPEDNVVGFLRYELHGNRQFIDLHPQHSIHTGGNGKTDIVKEKHSYGWTPWNMHSGNFLLSSEHTARIVDYTKPYCGVLETGATNVYHVFQKVIPNDYNQVAVWHMDEKYSGPTDNELTKLL